MTQSDTPGMSAELSLHVSTPSAPTPKRFNLAAYCLSPAERTPDKTALWVMGGPGTVSERWTYAELDVAIRRAAGGLHAAGLRQGDRVLLRLGDVSDFPILFFAAAGLGAIPIPTSAQLTAAEARAVAQDAEARLICASEELSIGLAAGGSEAADAPLLLSGDQLAEVLRCPNAVDFADTAADDPGYLVYTSGATSRPKGVLHAHRAVWARRMMWEDWYGLTQEDRVLHAGAFNWTYTLGAGLMDPWAAGAATIIYNGPRDPAAWPRLADATGATLFAAVPGVYRQLLKYGEDLRQGFRTLRHGLTAGEACPDPVREGWRAATGLELYEALGMSECSTFISSSPTAPPRPGFAGRPQRGRAVAVLPVDDAASAADAPTPRGVEGILAVRRDDPGLMLGYWRRPAEEAAAFRGDWFLTGDLAVMDADGYVGHRGRVDDLMNAQGYRVSPQEVEVALSAHPDVADCAVAEKHVRADVSVVAAHVVLRDGAAAGDALAEEILAHCAARLAAYKTPRLVVFHESLPRTVTGKVLRRALRTPS